MFVDREDELAFLNRILTRKRPGPGQLITLYGRRRVGKSALLQRWAEQTGVPFTYWVAEKDPAMLQRRKFVARWRQLSLEHAPIFETWSQIWQYVAEQVGEKQHILVLDEIPYVAESDPAMLSTLQHAWDQQFKNSHMTIVLCGSQVQAMESVQAYQSPLFGRMTGQWHLQPLPFYTLTEFFPNWTIEERIALYAMVGCIPAYLEWLQPDLSLTENIRQVILDPSSMFLAEPIFLLYDEVQQPQSYLAVLKALGLGNHTLDDIHKASLIDKAHLSSYLLRLQNLKMVSRQLPVTIPSAKKRTSRKGRYHLEDPYFRFYFRFLAPYYETSVRYIDPVLQKIKTDLRAFVGQTAFEELAREWVMNAYKRENWPFALEDIGAHWSRHVQIDVVGINWHEHQILLGECKWGGEAIKKQTLRELVEKKTAKLLKELPPTTIEWQVHYAFFARAGFTPTSQKYAQAQNMRLVDLSELERGLMPAKRDG